MSATGIGGGGAAADAAPAVVATGAGARDLSVEAILALPATWFHVFAVMHHLWGLARVGGYDKQKWAAFQSLLERVRARAA